MKKLILFLFTLSFVSITFAQIDTSKIINQVKEDVKGKSDAGLKQLVLETGNQSNLYQKVIDSLSLNIKSLTTSISRTKITLNEYNREVKELQKELEQIQKFYDSLNSESIKMRALLDVQKLQLAAKKEEQSKAEAATVKAEEKLEAAKTAIDSIKTLFEKEKDTALVIAEMSLMGDSAQIIYEVGKQNMPITKADYKAIKRGTPSNEEGDTIFAKIENIRLRINEGQILSIYVKTDQGIFRNKQAPISLVRINETREFDRLYREGDSSKQYLYIKDVVRYTPRRTYNYFPYIDAEFTLTKKDSIHYIKESTSINSYFDVAVFTDLKGIGGEPNGLAQISMNGKFILKTKNVNNTAIVPWNYVGIHGYLAKFDNDFKGTEIDSVTKKVDRLKLFQTSTYRIGAKLNVLHGLLSPMPKRLIEDIQLNVGYNFVGSKIMMISNKDTSQRQKIYDTTYKTVTHNQLYFEPMITFSRHSNFGCTISIPLILQNLKRSSGVTNRESIWYANPCINLSYASKRTPNSKIFFKYTHMIDLKNPEFAFNQMQLGYSANLTDIFSVSKN